MVDPVSIIEPNRAPYHIFYLINDKLLSLRLELYTSWVEETFWTELDCQVVATSDEHGRAM